MIRKLLIVFASGLVLSVMMLSTAWVIGGKELIVKIESDDWDHGKNRGPTTTRSLDFDGSKILRIDAPVSLRFTRGPVAKMTVEGPEKVIKKLRWEDGRLTLGGNVSWSNDTLEVTITAPQLVGLELHGAGDVELRNLDQPSLTIETHGAANVEADGKVQTLALSSHGAGSLDLERVDARDAKVEVAGVGDVDISATGDVDARISGAGNISLHRKPTNLTSRISGIGSIDNDYDETESR
jgi:hypothetical protein